MAVAIGLAALFSLQVNNAAAQKVDPTTWGFGIGTLSCNTWSSSNDTEYRAWIAGFWTALNITHTENHNIGMAGGVPDVIQAVNLECVGRPSDQVYRAAFDVYLRFIQEGR